MFSLPWHLKQWQWWRSHNEFVGQNTVCLLELCQPFCQKLVPKETAREKAKPAFLTRYVAKTEYQWYQRTHPFLCSINETLGVKEHLLPSLESSSGVATFLSSKLPRSVPFSCGSSLMAGGGSDLMDAVPEPGVAPSCSLSIAATSSRSFFRMAACCSRPALLWSSNFSSFCKRRNCEDGMEVVNHAESAPLKKHGNA